MGEGVDWTTVLERYGVLGVLCAFFLLMTWRCLSWLTKVVIPSLMKDVIVPLKDRSLRFFDGLETTHEMLKESARNTDKAVTQLAADRKEDRKIMEKMVENTNQIMGEIKQVVENINDTWSPPKQPQPRQDKRTHFRHKDDDREEG